MINAISMLDLFKSANVQQLVPTNLKTVSKAAVEEKSLLPKTNNHQMNVREMASAIAGVKNSDDETAALENQAKTMIEMMDSFLKKGKTTLATAPFIFFQKIVNGEIDITDKRKLTTIIQGPDGARVLVRLVKQNDGYTKINNSQKQFWEKNFMKKQMMLKKYQCLQLIQIKMIISLKQNTFLKSSKKELQR
mgnify:CR=1 FL=1